MREKTWKKRMGAISAVVVLTLVSCPAFASRLSPAWAKPAVYQRPNGSFLISGAISDSEDDNRIIDKTVAGAWRQEYEDLTRSYNMRQRYGLVTPDEERSYSQRMSSYTVELLYRVKSYQLSQRVDRVRKAIERGEVMGKLQRPAAVVLFLAAVYSGQTVEFRLNDSLRFRTMTNVPAQRGFFQIASPVVDGAFHYVVQAPQSRNPYLSSPSPDDPIRGEERYRISLSRPLPVFGLSTSISYGGTTSTLTTSVSREIAQNLSCVLDSSRNVNYFNPNGKNREETIRFLYGVGF